MREVIRFEHVGKSYENQIVLNDINLSIFEGEFVSIVGASGTGKSTILNIMGLLEQYNCGKVWLNGRLAPAINSSHATRMRRKHINYLFQSFALIEDRTVKDNLLLAMHFMASSNKVKQIKQVLNLLELQDKLNDVVGNLSGGEQQRIALARTLLKPGDIILADEPTGALDPVLAEQSFELLKLIQKRHHKTVVMVTHNMEQARRTDRVLKMLDLSVIR
ncbi:putative ABC transport system ATP-binding protein [Weissella uvarum]|uniref:ABC transporter ATP-binding protein n=1 Tax=Weissella uvarum TaxID=1479233 RepID=UPI001960998C|nr:ABC transporter ATP-binding protein [Weissella uvarum]MBM7617542.1 putative ABC transport system ATP-binding protein [Weissella uvarum]MCM0595576.1 ABC transporter ATP-binding protein [Weissella uvarum]